MINLLLNTLIYQNNNKIMIYFCKMSYDVYYHLVKFQPKTPPMREEMKKTNCIRG